MISGPILYKEPTQSLTDREDQMVDCRRWKDPSLRVHNRCEFAGSNSGLPERSKGGLAILSPTHTLKSLKAVRVHTVVRFSTEPVNTPGNLFGATLSSARDTAMRKM